MKLYVAGPLFTAAERSFNVRLARALETGGFEVWLPQEHEPRERSAREIFREDIRGMEWADAILACMDGPDPDSGTCFECGWAYAKGKPIVCYRSDFRGIDDGKLAPYNLMLSESATERLDMPLAFEGELIGAIATVLRKVGGA